MNESPTMPNTHVPKGMNLPKVKVTNEAFDNSEVLKEVRQNF